jgi:hypothetical protein
MLNFTGWECSATVWHLVICYDCGPLPKAIRYATKIKDCALSAANFERREEMRNPDHAARMVLALA